MAIPDMVMLSSLFVCIAIWTVARTKRHSITFSTAALTAMVAGCVAVLLGRWQAYLGIAVAGVFIAAAYLRFLVFFPARRGLWLSSAGLAMLAAASALPLYLIPVFELPMPGGAHAVGVQDAIFTDWSRLGVLNDPEGAPRKLLVRVWYPAIVGKGARPRKYASKEEIKTTFRSLAELGARPSFFLSHLNMVETHSYENAPVKVETGQPFRVVFYHPGYLMYPAQNTPLMEHLASHGYVVFSISHPYDSATLSYPDGSSIGPDLSGMGNEEHQSGDDVLDEGEDGPRIAGPVDSYDYLFADLIKNISTNTGASSRERLSAKLWIEDHFFVQNALIDGDAPGSLSSIRENSDFAKVAHIGMSFGGSTAGAVCYLDKNCAAAINLDGTDSHFSPLNEDIPAPFMMLHSELHLPHYDDNDFSYETFDRAGDRNDVFRGRIKKALHLGFSDIAFMLRQPLKGMITGEIDAQKMARLLNETCLEFLQRYVEGKENNFPKSIIEAYSEDISVHEVTGVKDWWKSKSVQEQNSIRESIDDVKTTLDY